MKVILVVMCTIWAVVKILYINDISASSSKFEFFLFADDTSLLYKDKSLSLLESVVNEKLTNVCDWSLAIKLTLNTKKYQPYYISSLSTEN